MSESNDVFAKPEPRQPSSASASSSSETQPQAPPLRYEKPHWGAVASYDYGFEVLKGGVSIEKITGPKKDCITLGTLSIIYERYFFLDNTPNFVRTTTDLRCANGASCKIYVLSFSHSVSY